MFKLAFPKKSEVLTIYSDSQEITINNAGIIFAVQQYHSTVHVAQLLNTLSGPSSQFLLLFLHQNQSTFKVIMYMQFTGLQVIHRKNL